MYWTWKHNEYIPYSIGIPLPLWFMQVIYLCLTGTYILLAPATVLYSLSSCFLFLEQSLSNWRNFSISIWFRMLELWVEQLSSSPNFLSLFAGVTVAWEDFCSCEAVNPSFTWQNKNVAVNNQRKVRYKGSDCHILLTLSM